MRRQTQKALSIFCILLLGGILLFALAGCFGEKYHVDYDGHKDWYKGAKDAYRAGQKVTVYYGPIATDTDYSFFLDGKELSAAYKAGKGFALQFTMPAHDVKLTTTHVNSMIRSSNEPVEKQIELRFHSFDGGGPAYTVTVRDADVVSYTSERVYAKANHEELDGAGYDMVYTFTGLKPGETQVVISARSPIGDNFDAVYAVQVSDALRIRMTEQAQDE